MTGQIKQVFEKDCPNLKINRRLLKTIYEIRTGFMNRNEDHVNFFTGNLLGVHPVRYRTVDRDQWFEEVLGAYDDTLSEDLRKVDAIDPSWVRASDAVNNSCIWLIHRIHNESSLSTKDREQGKKDVMLMLLYKFLTSILSHYFPYPADKNVATATYEALSRKYELKQLGSWQAYLEHRAEAILSKNSIHYTTYVRMNDDDAVVYMISDIQKRLRDVIKKMKTLFNKVKEENVRISTTGSMVEIEGEVELADTIRDQSAIVRYLKEVIRDRPTFIRMELVNAIGGIQQTMPEKHLVEALEYCSDNFGRGGDRKVEELVDDTLQHVFSYISENESVMSANSPLPKLMVDLRNTYMASRMSDEQLIRMRDTSEKIVKNAISSRNKAVIASVRTGLQLYIVLRSFARQYYQN